MTTPNLQKVPPSAFHLPIAAFEAGELTEDGKRKFTGKANSGAPMPHWYFGQVIVNMATLKVNRKDLPVLRDHDPGQIAGFTQDIKVSKAGIDVDGVVFDATPAGIEAMALLEKDYPMQMSVWVPPKKMTRLEAGATETVNGHKLTGPAVIFEDATLREVTLTALGADEGTSAQFGTKNPYADAHFTFKPSDDGSFSITTSGDDDSPVPEERETSELMSKQDDTVQKDGDKPVEDEGKFSDGVTQERERVAFIQERSKHLPEEFVAKAISEGWDKEKFLEQSFAYVTERKDARLEALRDQTKDLERAQADLDDDEKFTENEGKETPKADFDAMEPGEERWAAEYEANHDGCANFMSKEEYFASQRNPLSRRERLAAK
jgi:hypothetical protein